MRGVFIEYLEGGVNVIGFKNVYKGKTVLITGHTGFKGSWLSIWLLELGAKVVGYALDPYTERDNYVLAGLKDRIIDIRDDIRNFNRLNDVVQQYEPEFVFHLAAQPLVGKSYDCPVDTYDINVMGTINVLEAIKNCTKTKVGIMVTTDKCYENKETLKGYKETDALGGYDPYSSSKAATEIAISSWRRSYFNPAAYDEHGTSIASVRAGNVIGGGDWSKNRIVPDCIRALEGNGVIEIRSPKAIRPWQHVLDPLSGYLSLGEKLYNTTGQYSEAWNFGPEDGSNYSVWEMVTNIVDTYGSGTLLDASSTESFHESTLLRLNIQKARRRLNWSPTLTFDETIALTVEWYLNYTKQNVYLLCKEQIEQFMKRM